MDTLVDWHSVAKSLTRPGGLKERVWGSQSQGWSLAGSILVVSDMKAVNTKCEVLRIGLGLKVTTLTHCSWQD